MRFYRDGLDALAGDFVSAATASGTGGVPSVPNDQGFGPMSPAQLATLSRPLTDAEKKAVAEWRFDQESRARVTQNERDLDASRRAPFGTGARPGSVTSAYSLPSSIAPSKGRPLTETEKAKGAKGNESFLTKDAFWGLKRWQVGLLGVGVLAVGAGVVIAVVKR